MKMCVDALQITEAESRPVVHFGFYDSLSGKLPPGYIEPSMTIDDATFSWVLNCSQSASFREVITVEKYEHLTPFLRESFIRDSHRAGVFRQFNQIYTYETYCESTALHLQ